MDAIRSAMVDVVRRLRRMIGDPDKATWHEDIDLQETLDQWRTDQRYVPLRSEPTRTPGGFVYNHFYSDGLEGWEADVVLQDGSYQTLTPTTSELIVGHWVFDAQPGLPVYATGKTYDLNGAAADLLEAEAASMRRRAFDVTDKDSKMARSQIIANMLDLAAKYRAKQKPRSAPAARSDASGPGNDVSAWAGRGGWTNTGDPLL